MELQPAVRKLLNKRGIKTEEDITEFLSPKPQKTYDPFLLLNMEAGVDLILSSIKNRERICIYGDYDADGITATSVLLEVLSYLTDNLTYYIPSRFKEGYGLNCGALKKIKDDGADLVITVDCGSVSCEEVAYAEKTGLKMLVTDHHLITDKKSDCLVINPKQPGCPYPFKGLAGVGVAFKLAQALSRKTDIPKSAVNHTLDLVGIGTIGDIVPLVDENRTLAKYGLRAIHISDRPGLDRLISAISMDKKRLDSQNVSFGIVPHLNATGRIAEGKYGVSLMRAENEKEAESIVDNVISWNTKRKELQEATFEKCLDVIKESQKEKNIYVIYLEGAHEGVTGIVAGKIKDRFNRPAIIVTPTEKGMLKGTGRSVEGVNLYNLLKEQEKLFEKFGGHSAACGFTIKKENFQLLRRGLEDTADRVAGENPDIFSTVIEPDMVLNAEEVTFELAEEIEKLEPFGCGNEKPCISVEAVPVSVRRIGCSGQYISFMGILNNNREIRCVVFASADKYEKILQKGSKVSIIGVLEIQEWNRKRYLQINVKDVAE